MADLGGKGGDFRSNKGRTNIDDSGDDDDAASDVLVVEAFIANPFF
jgi:hypothetical protein